MKHLSIIALASTASLLSACATQSPPRPDDSSESAPPTVGGGDSGATPSQASTHMRIAVGSTVFTATLGDNETATAFKAMLPLTLNMTDLNANEKFFRFADNLPVNASNPGTIHSGDVMLYGSDTLVLFYKTFSTSYSYARIGKVDDASGLAAALGSGNVTVTFEL